MDYVVFINEYILFLINFNKEKFRKNILLTYSMNLILKIFLMEKDFTNQKNILKIIKCLILDGLYIFIMF